jgi:hypothetical protein
MRNEHFYSFPVAAERCAELSCERSAATAATHDNLKLLASFLKAGAPSGAPAHVKAAMQNATPTGSER